jgi:hypothetical protein
MSDDLSKSLIPTDVQKGVGRRETRDSQGSIRPSYLQQPDVVTLPPSPPAASQQGDSARTTTQSVANQTSADRGE